MATRSQVEEVTLRLHDQVSAPADKALGALGRLEAQIEREQRSLGRMSESLRLAKGRLSALASGGAKGDVVDVEKFRRQKSAVDALSDRIAAQQGKIHGLIEKKGALGKSAVSAKDKLQAVEAAMRSMGVAGVDGATSAGRLVQVLGKIPPQAIAVVAGLALITAGVAAFAAVVLKGISASSELREELLDLRVAGVFWWDAQRANIGAGLQLQASIDAVAATTAVAREKLVGYATQLRNSWFQGKNLEVALKGMAIAGAAGGDRLASQFLGLAQTTRLLGGDVGKLTEHFKKKFGDVADARMRSLGVQFAKFRENIAFIFSGADIEPFLKGLQSILSLFNRNEESAKSMRNLVTRLVETAIGGFLRLAIFLVRSYIWLRTNETAWKVIGLVVKGFGIVLGIMAGIGVAALVTLGAAAVAVVAAIGAIGAAIGFVAEQFRFLFTHFDEFKEGLKTIGSDMVRGIAEGIKSAATAVYDALKSVVSSGIDKVKSFLRMRSPSGLMRDQVGFQMGTGIALGHRDAEPIVQQSSFRMAESAFVGASSASPPFVPTFPALPPTSPTPASPPSSREFNFTNCNFGGDLTEVTMRKWLTSILEDEVHAGTEAA